jgi:iron complex transport system substrate-binding protein
MATAQRIVSFLPSATEMVYALGLEDRLVGVTHECDFPSSVKQKPVVVRSAVPVETMAEPEIDKAVSERIDAGLSVYQVDETLLRTLAPDLILVQDLCDVCAPSGNEVSRALKVLSARPDIVHLSPKSLAGIFQNVQDIGNAAGCPETAEQWVRKSSENLQKITAVTRQLPSRPRVFCMEWLDPLYCSGHWVPEMVQIAGGTDELSRRGSDSVQVSWDAVRRWAPEVLIVMPCGCHLSKVLELASKLASLPGWSELPAVQTGQVFAVDASSYFARPGPRIVQGVELLAHLIHPEAFAWRGPVDAYRKLDMH